MKFLNTSLEEIKIKVSNLENKIDEVAKENDFLKQESLKLSKENAKLVNVTTILSKEINDIQQYQRGDCML